MAKYGDAEYWQDRYLRDPEPFDWYQKYSGLREHLVQHIKPNHRILMVGCGNSRLSEEMYDDGFRNIHNVDISSVVIQAMQEKNARRDEMTWEVMDCTHMEPLKSSSFDVVIDKGTLDAILCGSSSTASAEQMCSECARVLKDEGVFILISYGQPESRIGYLDKPEYGWTVKHYNIPKPTIGAVLPEEKDFPNYHYIYVCTKK